jgi:hypothetical protein
MLPLVALGAAVAGIAVLRLLAGPSHTEIACRYLTYHMNLSYGGQIGALYVAATCAPMLLSSNRRLVAFGVANLAAVGTLTWLLAAGVISLWCARAAVTSVVVVAHFRAVERSSSVSALTAPA